MKYVIYLRVSTKEQGKSGLGLEAQKHNCLSFIEKNNPGAKYIEFIDTSSGALDVARRKVLLEAINELKKDDVLLVAKRDRLARNVANVNIIESLVKSKRANIISCDIGVVENHNTRAMMQVTDVFSELERGYISQRTKEGLAKKIARGERCGRIPYGYKLAFDGIHLTDCEKERAILSKMVKWKSDGMTYRQIADQLNQGGLLSRQESEWWHGSVYRLIQRETKNRVPPVQLSLAFPE